MQKSVAKKKYKSWKMNRIHDLFIILIDFFQENLQMFYVKSAD